ncbi:NAD(P)-binding domain-containing protein [Arthrobacter sp. M4]|uniref:NAD(P)-binding domain-containing protein n=1 Tax=Arthrobacter sp. M4 TaxID=218160 RepID=UPI001CDB7ED3|nr:NAD(P)-binding domain-containing protein [Arthrobacter sp. M4]MCA4132542.1 hypothetical protein [Arthrobacter sp. M4]
MSNVAVIGLGVMGLPMAVNPSNAEHTAASHSRRSGPTEPIATELSSSGINEAVSLNDIMGIGIMGVSMNDDPGEAHHPVDGPTPQPQDPCSGPDRLPGASRVAEAVQDADIVPHRTWCTLMRNPKEALQRMDELGYLVDEETRARFDLPDN